MLTLTARGRTRPWHSLMNPWYSHVPIQIFQIPAESHALPMLPSSQSMREYYVCAYVHVGLMMVLVLWLWGIDKRMSLLLFPLHPHRIDRSCNACHAENGQSSPLCVIVTDQLFQQFRYFINWVLYRSFVLRLNKNAFKFHNDALSTFHTALIKLT